MPLPRSALLDFALLIRFGLAGLANTAVGLSIIALLDLGLHWPPALANAAGYAVGVCVSFFLSRRFVFRSNAPVRGTGPRYLAVVAGGFILNQGVLALAGHVLGPTRPAHVAAQLLGMATYTLSVLIASRLWVFPPSEAQTLSARL
jgi:putative flippase GtrA